MKLFLDILIFVCDFIAIFYFVKYWLIKDMTRKGWCIFFGFAFLAVSMFINHILLPMLKL